MSDLTPPHTHYLLLVASVFFFIRNYIFYCIKKNSSFLKKLFKCISDFHVYMSLLLALYSSFKIRFLETFPSRLKDLVWHLLQGTSHGYKPFHISTEILFPLFSVLRYNFMSRRVLDSYFFYSKLKVFDSIVFWVLLFLRRNVCLLH